jgi:predicted DCC family thiol-disulfide oxidoreductase YuxK
MTTATAENPVQPVSLPSPAQRPEADVVLYDGNCRICSSQIRRLPWWDCQGNLSYLSLHDPEVGRRYPDLTHDMLMRDMYIVDRAGHRHRGAAAIRYLSRRLRRLWWLAPVLHIPFSLPVWQFLYRQIADRRYRFGRVETCDGDACSLHGRGVKTETIVAANKADQ